MHPLESTKLNIHNLLPLAVLYCLIVSTGLLMGVDGCKEGFKVLCICASTRKRQTNQVVVEGGRGSVEAGK